MGRPTASSRVFLSLFALAGASFVSGGGSWVRQRHEPVLTWFARCHEVFH